MNDYLIPANSKKSLLIMGMFKGSDLWILGIGISISLILMFGIKGDEVGILVIKLLPLAIAVLLIFCGYLVVDIWRIARIKGEQEEKYAVFWAFQLYLDIINIIIKLLQLFGKRK